MRMQRSIITAFMLSTLAVPAYAAVYLNADINLGPPEPQYEYIPAPRPGYVWSPGYWQWDGRSRYWIDGYWVEERPNYVWIPDRWDHYNTGWRFNKGHYYNRPGYAPRPVVVNRYIYNTNDHRDNGNHGHDNDHRDNGGRMSTAPDNRGAGVSNFHNNGRSNGHGPYEH